MARESWFLLIYLLEFQLYSLQCFYSPQTKLRKGNIFTAVCHSVREMCIGPWVSTHYQTWDLPPTTDIWWLSLETWDLPSPCYWHLVVITGYLFKLVHLRTYPQTSTCSKWWLPKHVQLVSGWNASYCNAVLFNMYTNFRFWCGYVGRFYFWEVYL